MMLVVPQLDEERKVRMCGAKNSGKSAAHVIVTEAARQNTFFIEFYLSHFYLSHYPCAFAQMTILNVIK